MVDTPDRRQVARLAVPSRLGGLQLRRVVRLLDLSAEGVRIEHPRHLHEGLVMFVDLPPDLGGSVSPARLSGPDSARSNRPWRVTSRSPTRAASPSLGSRLSSRGRWQSRL